MAKWGRCDYEQLIRLKERLDGLVEKDGGNEAFFEACAKEIAARLLAQVIRRTPVGDYRDAMRLDGKQLVPDSTRRGGTLRRGWTAHTEAEAEAGTGGGQDVIAFLDTLKVQKNGGTYQIQIVNPVRWASYVEHGHRQTPGRYVPAIGKRLKAGWVKGQHMLEISENEVRRQAPGVIERKLVAFLKEALDG